jgi:hypothetical protein
MLGRSVADAASSSWDVSDDEIADPEQLATKRRRTARHAKAPKDILLLTLKGPSPLYIDTKHLLSFRSTVFRRAHVNPRTLEEAEKGLTCL